MKRWSGVWLAWAWSALALAGDHEADWVREWPLALEEGRAAYRLELTPALYRSIQAPDLGDLQVFDARGAAVPTRVGPAEIEAVEVAEPRAVPWFPLPVPEAPEARWELIGETDAQGRLYRVETRGGEAPAGERQAGAALVDLSDLAAPVVALELAWDAAASPVDSSYRVEASDDLERWRTVQSRGRLLDLAHQGERIVRRRLSLGGVSATYLRLRPLPGEPAVPLTGIGAVPAPERPVAPREWRVLEGRRQADGSFHYRLDGRFPVDLADIEGTGTASWTLRSREDEEDAWRRRASPWIGYRLDDAAGVLRSPPQPLRGPVRDRDWRLTAAQALTGEPPRLRLGYRPERLVFLAQGEVPFRLAAGSLRARRQEAPVAPVLASLRERHGDAWRPSPATLGEARELAGKGALRPERDWTTWLLWAVLVGGAALVAGLALRLLRRAPGP
ncbi:DUF3999 domain-containing protein [Halomonas ramblicola]|uniref:DUF3999 domain-containing protein n=1 Tax=Halomonas ramblicola TaxID=747349 RepID=UPI0025B34441|nr:DUF3999 domain-containing protein [Halomonas ramblicola]MDN3521318.1 DUF3999 domain-containing protein [Halomonas ramblicola]